LKEETQGKVAPNKSIQQAMAEDSIVYRNVGQEVIETTADKVRLCLRDYQDSLRSQRDWVAPLALIITLVTTLATSTFKNLIVSASLWQGTYLVAAIGTSMWLIYSVARAITLRKATSVETVVQKLKNSKS
jgi:hypothetical protein